MDKRRSPVDKQALVLLRGGGDLASGVALRLHSAGIKVVITELAQPLAVRRTVSFAETVYEGQQVIEGVTGRLVKPEQIPAALEAGEIPVLVDPNADILLSSLRHGSGQAFLFLAVIDARLMKQPPASLPTPIQLHIGLGPGFHAGVNCHAVIETRRSHTLGRVYWDGTTQPDSGQPEGDPRRVLRAPSEGMLSAKTKIGEHVEEGQVVAVIHPDAILSPSATLRINSAKNLASNTRDSSPSAHTAPALLRGSDTQVVSPMSGVLRGLIHDGLHVTKGLKIGDVDPRDDPSACLLVSDKALSIGGAALEAILTREEIRERLFTTKARVERSRNDTKEH